MMGKMPLVVDGIELGADPVFAVTSQDAAYALDGAHIAASITRHFSKGNEAVASTSWRQSATYLSQS
jgi:hypothetical protein